MKPFNLHLVSDSTGETVGMLARACLVQFDEVEVAEFVWPMIRKKNQLKHVLKSVEENPGLVLFTIVNPALRKALEDECEALHVPYLSALDPVIASLGTFFKVEAHPRPGAQHTLSAANFERIEAINFALNHDDGRCTPSLNRADVILIGVSRVDKTPTSIYLSTRGIKTANVPVVPGSPLPEELFTLSRPVIIGLTKDPKRLIQVRTNRLVSSNQDPQSDYADIKTVEREIKEAEDLFTKHGWPMVDITGKSIEETAIAVQQILRDNRDR